MAGHQDLTKDVDIDVAGLFSKVWKYKFLILGLSLVVAALLFMVLSSIAPRYRSTAQLIIEPRESVFTRPGNQQTQQNNAEFDDAAIRSQVQIIGSEEIAKIVIKKLDLTSKEEFKAIRKQSLTRDLMVLAGIAENSLNLKPEDRVLREYRKRLKVFSIEQSRVIEINFWANDPKLAKLVTGTIASEYLALQRRNKLETDSDATSFLEPEIEALRKKVTAAEAKVAEFRSNSDILTGNNNSLLATQQLSEVSSELSRVRGRRAEAQARAESIRATLETGGSLDAIPEVVASPLIQRLRERQVQLQAQISELSTTLLSNHPRLKALKSQVADFERQIRRETRAIMRSLESSLNLTSNQEERLVQELNRLKAEAARAGEAEVQMRALEREAASERELLQAYMIRYREAAGRQSSKYVPVNARIISSATTPTESFYPKTLPLTIAGFVATLILSILGTLTIALLNGSALKQVDNSEGSLQSQTDIPQDSGLAYQTVQPVPENTGPLQSAAAQTPAVMANKPTGVQPGMGPGIEPATNPNSYPNMNPSTSAKGSELYAAPEGSISVDLAFQALMPMGRARVCVVSPGGDEGSATTWLLTQKLAMQNRNVVIIDLTGSGVTSKHMVGTTTHPGASDMMAGSASLDEIIYRDPKTGVSIIPIGRRIAGETTQDPLQTLSLMIDVLEDNYDMVFIDCGLTGLEGLQPITNASTIVLISAIHAVGTKELESQFIQNRLAETIIVAPTKTELESLFAARAA